MTKLVFPTSDTDLTFGDFETSPIGVTETDTGNVVHSFTDYFPSSGYIGRFTDFVSTGTTGAETAVMKWSGFQADVSSTAGGTGGTLDLQFDYDLSTTAPNSYITSLGQL